MRNKQYVINHSISWLNHCVWDVFQLIWAKDRFYFSLFYNYADSELRGFFSFQSASSSLRVSAGAGTCSCGWCWSWGMECWCVCTAWSGMPDKGAPKTWCAIFLHSYAVFLLFLYKILYIPVMYSNQMILNHGMYRYYILIK